MAEHLKPKEILAPEGEERQKQIADWKAELGETAIKAIVLDKEEFGAGKGEAIAFVKKPGIKTMTIVAKVGADDPMRAVKVMLNDCVLACDPEFCTNEYMYLELSERFAEFRKNKGSEIKNV